nr:MAG TPA: hypothetical protein [Caudoviricetes sp.]
MFSRLSMFSPFLRCLNTNTLSGESQQGSM